MNKRLPGSAAPRTVIEVKVKTGAPRSALTRCDDGSWLAHLKAAPVKSQANAELIALVARHFGCAKSAVSLKSGAAARRKRLQIDAGA